MAALDRSRTLRRRLVATRGLTVVSGDLLESGAYVHLLRSSDLVIHLAAATGRATRADHLRTNALGTETLLRASREAGVARFLFVSSIAARFPDRRGYHYAEAKVRAEDAVRRSGLPFAILRPTMIFGPGSPVLGGLETLARLPVMPVFGDGRTMVQPIDVADVVHSILHVIDARLFDNTTFEIGGREALTIEALLQRIRIARRGAPGRALHVPLRLVLGPLRAAEAAGLSGFLPVTAGQLSSFRFAGTVTPNLLQTAIEPAARSVTDMLADASVVAPGGRFDRECRTFARHLLRVNPDEYVRRKYAEAHEVLPGLSAPDRFENMLVRFARAHRILAAVADAYARVFLPDGLLRRKLVLLLALLETSSPSAALVDREVGGSAVWVSVRLVGRGLGAAARLAVGTALFVPTRLLVAGRVR